MQDTISSQKHLVLIRSMGELDKNAIAKRLGKFSRCDLSEIHGNCNSVLCTHRAFSAGASGRRKTPGSRRSRERSSSG